MNQSRDPSQACLELCVHTGKGLYKLLHRRLEPTRLTPVQLQVLAELARGDALTMSDLGERLCCAGSNVTAVVARMVEAGWVKREASRRDRRARLLRLTARGKRALGAVAEAPRCCPEAAQWLSQREWAQLRRLLEKLQRRLQADQDRRHAK